VFDSVEGVLEGIETIDEILTVPERPDKWEQFRWMAAHWNDYDLAFFNAVKHKIRDVCIRPKLTDAYGQ